MSEGVIIRPSDPLVWLPIYYLHPVEMLAMANEMGEKAWAKCVEKGRRRKHNLVQAVAHGAEIRLTRRLDHDMRPPAEWLTEAKINTDSVRKAWDLVKDDFPAMPLPSLLQTALP